jgi:hypothetical protein
VKKSSLLFFFIILLTLSTFVFTTDAYGQSSWTPTTDEATILDQQIDLSLDLLYDYLPPDYFAFATREALACHLSIHVAPLDNPNLIGSNNRGLEYLMFGAYESDITLNSTWYSSWEVANFQIIVHELVHAGATGTGNDAQGYSKLKEVNAHKREAEYWRDKNPKPARDNTGGPCACWATYDIVFNKDGTQRTQSAM